jgi:hypothetical protein
MVKMLRRVMTPAQRRQAAADLAGPAEPPGSPVTA